MRKQYSRGSRTVEELAAEVGVLVRSAHSAKMLYLRSSSAQIVPEKKLKKVKQILEKLVTTVHIHW